MLQTLLDHVYNDGYCTPAALARAMGYEYLEAEQAFQTLCSPEDFTLLVTTLRQVDGELVQEYELRAESPVDGRVTAAVSPKMLSSYPELMALLTAISRSELSHAMEELTYGINACTPLTKIRDNLERRNAYLQISDETLVQYSQRLLYSLHGPGQQDVKADDAAAVDDNDDTISIKTTSTSATSTQPGIKELERTGEALQGVSGVVRTETRLTEEGELKVVRCEKVEPKPKQKKNTTQKGVPCDLMRFVRVKKSQ